MNWAIERVESCGSTQELALERAKDGAPDGALVVAESMAGGKGQHGRAWHAPAGGWYASMVLRDIADPRFLTLALGNAVADIVEIAGADAQVKWVNDVWVGGKKIAGVLVDAESTGDSFDFMVAGIGINMNGTTAGWPDGLGDHATTLEAQLGAETCIEDVEPFMLETIAGWLDKVRAGRKDEIVAAFRARDALLGKQVSVDGQTGEAGGITDDGALLVDGAPVLAGSVALA